MIKFIWEWWGQTQTQRKEVIMGQKLDQVKDVIAVETGKGRSLAQEVGIGKSISTQKQRQEDVTI